jgi:hypothetical protein
MVCALQEIFEDLTYLVGGSMLCSVFDIFGFRLQVRSHKESITCLHGSSDYVG